MEKHLNIDLTEEKRIAFSASTNVSYNPTQDAATQQLLNFGNDPVNSEKHNITTVFGAVMPDHTNVLTVGPRGPLLVKDRFFQEVMASFDRERIPERVVYAKGAAAFGYFELTDTEIQKYCKADLFSELGKRTPVVARFSKALGESGSPDTVRNPRGFAVKFYTQEGNWDLVGNNTPVYFIRDPLLFPSLIHSNKRNPKTHLFDYNASWDFFTLRHETLHQITWMFADKGIPDGYRHMDGWSGSAYKLVNSEGKAVYTKFYWSTCQGIRNLSVELAKELQVKDTDYAIHDLYDAIASKAYPSWILSVQIMTFEEADDYEFNPFDITKVWRTDHFPLIEVGRMVLNRNPINYFAQVEQLSFAPMNRVSGIEFSPDKMLQGRLFAYQDTSRYRLGANYHLIPVNKPINQGVFMTERDGPMQTSDNEKDAPSYYPNSFYNAVINPKYMVRKEPIQTTDIYRFESKAEDNYTQVRDLYLNYSEGEKQRLYDNIASSLSNAYDFIQKRAFEMFSKVDSTYGAGVEQAIKRLKSL